MVVEYPSGAESSVWSFFTIYPRVLFQYRGSIVPALLPQVMMIQCIAFLAVWLAEEGIGPLENITKMAQKGTSLLGILVSFLLVFKTQAANSQFWQALTHLNSLLHLLRSIGISTCTIFDWKQPEVKLSSRRIVRFLCVYYYVVLEYFQRTGGNATVSHATMNRLRDEVRALTGENEFLMLYPGEPADTQGADSKHPTTKPTIVLFWISLAMRNILDHKACEPPIMSNLIGQLSAVGGHFWSMDKIDKTQFPLPYAQIVKWLTLFFLCILPFTLAQDCGWWTLVFSAVATVGFFGLDEVAEILESPFGDDPNDLDIRAYGEALMQDLELMVKSRDFELETVFAEDQQLCFYEKMRNLGEFKKTKHVKRSSSMEERNRYDLFVAQVQPVYSATNLKQVVPSE
eukprot:TRINITY_DN24044_c0_g1_i1.p1 TRINITY_DN24044_c0_g1~~TRINITY_DN24044_c0_g1_i1.p1  ORF type:complete len:401 (+),score=89.58 TRINITY_DN24044_c0_g1_i1:62-1264(+)